MACKRCEEAKNRGLTIIDKAGNFIYAAGKVGAALATGQQVLSLDEKVKYRLNKCNRCEYIHMDKKTCNLCGCFIVAKTKLETESCPAGKW